MLSRFLRKSGERGSALLVALLVMGVIISISLLLSSLVFRELRVTKELFDSGRAYYAAESAVEVSLYKLNNNLAGWEPDLGRDGYAPVKLGDDFEAVGEYRLSNRCNAYPCFDEEFDRRSLGEDLQAYYDVLELNESINIPLFVVDESGVEVPVGDFTVEFFANFDPQRDIDIDLADNFVLSSWDVLRWKVVGIADGQTRSLGDFAAVSNLVSAGTDESQRTNAKNPSWIGSVRCTDANVDGSERYTDEIVCREYRLGGKVISVEQRPEQIAPVFTGLCLSTEGSQFYDFRGDGRVDDDDIFNCYPISEFLANHRLNYLTLTNLMNPRVFNDAYDREKRLELSKLFYRVEFFENDKPGRDTSNETVREVASITANGYSGNAKQSISVQMRRGSFIPVFNFSLYSTYEQ